MTEVNILKVISVFFTSFGSTRPDSQANLYFAEKRDLLESNSGRKTGKDGPLTI